ncbi:MAG: rhamnulokinase [Bacteroidales bacterium]|nr:rhamnulokinase [Bacteroidales bacterium]
MAKYYIAVDMGATSGRVILATVADRSIELQTVHRFKTPLLEMGGKYYWNIYAIYEEIVSGLTRIGGAGLRIESIGIDTWGVDFACVADDGTVSLPRSYRDPYTADIPGRFFKKMPREELYMATGIQIMNFNTVFQLFAQHREGCSALENADKILFMPDALAYMLTGKKVCEYTSLSTSAFMNPFKKRPERSILRKCHVCRRRFPKVVMPGTRIGKLTEELAGKTGLGGVPVIAVAGHDTASAIAAVPAIGKNFAYLSSGTWSLMGIETDSPVINGEMLLCNFTNEGGVGGANCLLKNITGMWLLEQCLSQWRAEGREYTYERVQEMASACPKCHRLIDPDDPSFAAPQNMPSAIGAYCRSHSVPVPEDDAQMVRLIYDSLAAKYALTLKLLKQISPFSIETLHIIGGGSQNRLLNQLTADACGIPVIAGPAEATALGNVMVQAGLSRKEIAASVETETYMPA